MRSGLQKRADRKSLARRAVNYLSGIVLTGEIRNGAEGETRTLTGVSPLRPEHSVYTNFTTSAFHILMCLLSKHCTIYQKRRMVPRERLELSGVLHSEKYINGEIEIIQVITRYVSVKIWFLNLIVASSIWNAFSSQGNVPL